jgi:quercetin dioxygenase-like cupin family protein
MTNMTPSSVRPIALDRDAGEAVWFLGSLLTIKASAQTTDGAVAVIEHLSPPGFGSPLHAHSREDEWFYIMEGEVTFWGGGETHTAAPGGFVYGPRGIPHTFLVTSPEPARYLLVTEPGGFADFVRALSRPAEDLVIPP